MASISHDSNGRKRILFVNADGERKAIRLGKMSQRMAEEIKIRVEALNAAKIGGCSLDRETAAWLAERGDDLHQKLVAVGLATARTAARLGEFIAAYIARRTNIAPRTVLNLETCGRRLTDHFGADRDMRSITEGDADGWILWMKEWPYAEATIGRSLKRAKQFFRAAIRAKAITANPFDGIKASVQTNDKRQFHVSREIIAKAIDAAPDHEWRLLIALSRYGGLRCPSEHLVLEWRDIDWECNRFLVRSSKTGSAGCLCSPNSDRT
jgi:hypothetical protein